MHWQTKTRKFWAKCAALSQGTSGKNRIKPALFLSIKIPLPPLSEQRRIVARIEELAAKVEEARGLRQQSAAEAEQVAKTALNFAFESQTHKEEWSPKSLGEAAEIARGKFANRPRNDPRFYGGNIPFIQIGDISKSNR